MLYIELVDVLGSYGNLGTPFSYQGTLCLLGLSASSDSPPLGIMEGIEILVLSILGQGSNAVSVSEYPYWSNATGIRTNDKSKWFFKLPTESHHAICLLLYESDLSDICDLSFALVSVYSSRYSLF